MRNRTRITNTCGGGKGNGGCNSKDLFTLPFAGGKRTYPRRLRIKAERPGGGNIVGLPMTAHNKVMLTVKADGYTFNLLSAPKGW